MKLYFLTGLPTETDEDTLGIAELARNCVDDRPASTPSSAVGDGRRSAASCPSRTRRSSGSGRTPSSELQRKVNLLRDDAPPRPRGVQLKWHDPQGDAGRGHRQPRRPPHRRRSSSDVWRDGGTFQEWCEHFDLDLLGRRRWPPTGLSIDWYVHRHRTEDEVLPWDHISAGLHKDFLWQDWQDALAELGLEDCRWTPCYDCGACTGYGIEHVVASAVPPAGGSQGTGQDLAAAARCRCSCCPAEPVAGGGGGRDAGPAAVHQAGQGPLHQPPRRGPHVGAGAAPGRAAVAYTEGFSPRPKLNFGLALPTGHESLAEYLDVDLDATSADASTSTSLPGRLTAALPVGIDVHGGRRRSTGGQPSLQQDVTVAAPGASSVRGRRRRPRPSRGRRPRSAAATLVVTRERKGNERHRRRPSRHPRPRVGAATHGRSGRRSRPSWPPSPAACGPSELLAACFPTSPTDRHRRIGCCEPTNGSSATAPAGSLSRSPATSPTPHA